VERGRDSKGQRGVEGQRSSAGLDIEGGVVKEAQRREAEGQRGAEGPPPGPRAGGGALGRNKSTALELLEAHAEQHWHWHQGPGG